MKKLIINRGCPGSGKSTWAASYKEKALKENLTVSIRSTDEQFYKDGFYVFDRNMLGTFHNRNLQYTIDDMKAGIDVIIIDNTNVKPKDYKGYIRQAELFGYEVEYNVMTTPLEICLERNNKRPADRKVPEDIVRTMFKTLTNIP